MKMSVGLAFHRVFHTHRHWIFSCQMDSNPGGGGGGGGGGREFVVINRVFDLLTGICR